MKLNTLFDYAQVHASIWCVLNGLRSPYVEAHRSYDQTHGPYGEAHALRKLVLAGKLLNRNYLTVQLSHGQASIWNGLWFG
jgi:hypothetical protein